MTKKINTITCEKIYIILNELNLFKKLPFEKQSFIEEKRDKNFKFEYNKNIPLKEQIKDKETMVVLSYLFLKYINEDKQIKKVLIDRYKQNEIEYRQEIKEKYNPDNIFKKKEIEPPKEEQSLTAIPKEKGYSQIMKFFKNFLKGKK